jgi:hypothetical protein
VGEEKFLVLGPDNRRQLEALRYTFDEPGEYTCTVTAVEENGEIDSANNSQSVKLCAWIESIVCCIKASQL